VKELARSIRELDPGGPVRLMHVCGTHENALCQFGLRDLFPPWLTLIAGPGCPVCVCPAGEIDMAVRAATEKGALVASFGDVMRVPARVSLADAQAAGADCRVVYSIDDAVDLARSGPKRTVVFFAVGFETTACTTAAALKRGVPENFLVLSSHRVVPPALEALLSLGRSRVDGFLLPGHVTTVAGLGDYEALGQRCRVPMAVAGFEPVDILLAVKDMVARQGSRGERFEGVTNAYRRSVRAAGNPTAVAVTREVFTPSDAAWRGLGVIPRSGLALRPAYAAHDARVVLGLAPDPEVRDLHPGCRCGEVLLGDVEPEDCPLFGARCTPDDPLGACMVAFEGTCHARHRAGHRRKVGA
jgi:hydrogenase expression/formation protein HypD